MAKKKTNLANIVNMVAIPGDQLLEIYIATADGSFGRFIVPNQYAKEQGMRELEFQSLTLENYLSQTQHHIDKNVKTGYASRSPSEGQ